MLPKINTERVREVMHKAIGIAYGMEKISPELKAKLERQEEEWEEFLMRQKD